MNTTTTIRTTRYAAQDRVVRVVMAICFGAAIIGVIDLLKSL